MTTQGVLFVVATPIGNLDDISSRARSVLASVDVVAAEDTRHTGALLERLGIRARLISLHEHNELRRVPQLIEQLIGGARVALVSDAGTPLISDPGFRLVAAAGQRGVTVTPVPGCCAAIAALSVAGLPSDRFHFEGFLPARHAARMTRLAELANLRDTIIFYEAGHRIGATLADLTVALGPERPAVVARELTKLHETYYRGTLGQIAAAIEADCAGHKGEFTLLVGGQEKQPAGGAELERVTAALLSELPPSQAASLAARLTGASRKDAYRVALRLAEAAGADRK